MARANFQGMTIRHAPAMSVGTRLFHYSMIFITFGLWIPFYLMSKRSHGER